MIGYQNNFRGKKENPIFNKHVSCNNSIFDTNLSVSGLAFSSSSLPSTTDQINRLSRLVSDKSVLEVVIANMADVCFPHNNLASGWIIDSRVNQHVIVSGSSLVNGIDISDLGFKVDHPNGTSVDVQMIGDLKLTDKITLVDVLVVPEFHVNLLSVHKLAGDSKCFVVFDTFNCYIKDLLLKENMGIGFQHEGLYFF